MLTDPRSIRAVSIALGAETAVDPFLLAAEKGILFAGERMVLAARGKAAILPLPQGLESSADLAAAQAWLAAVPHTDQVGRPGAKVTAFGSLDFVRSAPGQLIVPEITYGRGSDGRRWATVIAPGPDGPSQARLDALPGELASLCTGVGLGPDVTEEPLITPHPPEAEYERAVAAALEKLDAGTLQKVVLARSVEARFEASPAVGAVLRRLHAQEPSCTIFAFPLDYAGDDGACDAPGGGRFLGASPELLVRRKGATVTCHPLAGTVGLDELGPRSRAGGRADGDAIRDFLASAKDRSEHRFVVDEIVSALQPLCDELDVPTTPSLVKLHTVAHFGTLVQGTLRQIPRSDCEAGCFGTPSILELLAILHPTPAVGGVPRPEALDCIATLEPDSRDHWAGPVGWVDAAGDGEWMIGIRSATVTGRTARLTAGAGIVSGSDPHAELEETTVKLASVLEAFSTGAARLLREAQGSSG